jgi:hypothetical protein
LALTAVEQEECEAYHRKHNACAESTGDDRNGAVVTAIRGLIGQRRRDVSAGNRKRGVFAYEAY